MQVARIVLASLLLFGCKRIMTAPADAGPLPAVPPAASVATPQSTHAGFAADDDVAVVKEDGTFEVDGIVNEVGGPIVWVDAKAGNAAAARLSESAWLPIAEAGPLTGTEKKSAKGFKIRVGTGRVARAAWFPSAQVFPVPWITGPLKAGDTFLQRRTGPFESPKCKVTSPPLGPHLGIGATCAGSDERVQVERDEMLATLRAPNPGEPKPGDIVYSQKLHFALVKGNEGDRVVLRETGYNSADIAVLRSAIELVH